jgi:hypothetical protein
MDERTIGCDEAGPLISIEIDGAASEAERLLVARHLARCGACARMRADFLSLGARAGAADPFAGAAPPPPVWEAIDRHIRAPLRDRGPALEESEASARPAGEALPAASVPAVTPPTPAAAPLPAGGPSPLLLRRLRWAAAVAAVAGAFVAGRWSAPAPSTAPGGGPAVAAAPAVSQEAEDKAVAALFGALFQGGAGGEIGERMREATAPQPLQSPASAAEEKMKQRRY